MRWRTLRRCTLADEEIIRPLTDRKRNQVWGAAAILDELDDLGARIERHARGWASPGAASDVLALARAGSG